MSTIRTIIIVGFACVFLTPAARVLRSQDASQPTEGELYRLTSFTVPIDPTLYSNPFNADDIELLGVFTSPEGERRVVPGFWMQPYEDVCPEPCAVEELVPLEDPFWQVRFTPDEVGQWAYVLQVRDDGAVISEQEGVLNVAPSDHAGFIHAGSVGRYFQYDNGAPYFPVGHNLNWSWRTGGGIYTYEKWLDSLSAAGGNYARLYIDAPWFIGLEWDSVGWYRQEDAARLDRILQMAEERGIALQLVILWHQALTIYHGPPVLVPEEPVRPDISADWDNNPYNTSLGGPLTGPGVFFFDQGALRLFRQRLRYIVARYGYSPAVFAWEIVDEIDQTTTYTPDVADRWLRDMTGFIRQIDTNNHLITAGSREFDPVVSGNTLLDFTSGQFYQRLPIEQTTPQIPTIMNIVRSNRQLNDSPTLITSYSLNPWYEPVDTDPDGIHFQNTLWAAALSGAAGGAMSAWGETYVIPRGLERYYPPLTAFASGVDWPNLNLQSAEAGLLVEDRSIYRPVRLTDFNRRLRAPLVETVTRAISPDGVFPDPQSVPSYLYGQVYNNQFNQPQHYRVVSPVNTYFEVGIRSVSPQADARLVIAVDNEVHAEFALQSGTTDVASRIRIPVGEHTITLTNSGEDWLEMEYIEVGQLVAPARVITLRDSEAGVALAWLQHRDYTWENHQTESIQPITFTYRLDNMPPGRYIAEIWDPISGAVLGEDMLTVGADRVFLFDLLPMNRQMALRTFRVPDEPPPVPFESGEATESLDAPQTDPNVEDDLSSMLTRVPRGE